jgi:hypothetical protein
MAHKGRQNTKTALSLAPLTVDEALAAMLKTPPPKSGRAPNHKTDRTRTGKRRIKKEGA